VHGPDLEIDRLDATEGTFNLKLPRFGGVFCPQDDYGPAIAASIIAS
jgi:hypothetical protein